MTRVILTLLLLCQPFCLQTAEIEFSEPSVLPLGEAARPEVVIVRNAQATQAFAAQPAVVDTMVTRGVTALTGHPDPREAWQSLVSPQDVVGVKVYSPPGPASGTRPAVAAAVIKGLLSAGHPPHQIVLWDRHLADLQRAGFTELASSLGVRVAGAVDAGFDPDVAYENPLLGQLVYGDLDFGRTQGPRGTNSATGRYSYLSRLLTRDLTRLINIAPLLNHNSAGVSGILYTVAGAATDNFFRFETNPLILSRAVPEIYGQTNIADRVALNVVDALIGQYEGLRQSLLHRSAALNEVWFSRDPVALDVLSLVELKQLRGAESRDGGTSHPTELYSNARLLELGNDDPRRIRVLRLN